MSNSTYIEEEDYMPREKTFIEEKLERREKELDKALDFIIELVEDDPSSLCEVVMENEEDYCKKFCDEFNHYCLKKFLKYYKKELDK